MDWCMQLIFAIEYLHDQKFLHGKITVSALSKYHSLPLGNSLHFWSILIITAMTFQTRNIYLCHKNKILKLGSPDIGSEQTRSKNLGFAIGLDFFRDYDMPPEYFNGKGCSLANDMWALGLVLANMMLLSHPFPAKVSTRLVHHVSVQPFTILAMVAQDLITFVTKIQQNDRLPMPDVYSTDIKSVTVILV